MHHESCEGQDETLKWFIEKLEFQKRGDMPGPEIRFLSVSPKNQPGLQVILASWFPGLVGKNPTAILHDNHRHYKSKKKLPHGHYSMHKRKMTAQARQWYLATITSLMALRFRLIPPSTGGVRTSGSSHFSPMRWSCPYDKRCMGWGFCTCPSWLAR